MSNQDKRLINWYVILGGIGIIILMILAIGLGSASFRRSFKTFKSEYGGGMNRTVTLYDYNGNEIKRWTGKFDVESNDSKVLFDNNGKRVIIYNGIVVNEEE